MLVLIIFGSAVFCKFCPSLRCFSVRLLYTRDILCFFAISAMPYLLLFVVLVEGFTTLAMQMVALRHAIPLVGSSIILTSVVIGVILLALAV